MLARLFCQKRYDPLQLGPRFIEHALGLSKLARALARCPALGC
jgi:hypothetical protein